MKVKYVYTCNYDDYVPHNISSLQLRAGTYIRWLVFFWETVHVAYIAQGAYTFRKSYCDRRRKNKLIVFRHRMICYCVQKPLTLLAKYKLICGPNGLQRVIKQAKWGQNA